VQLDDGTVVVVTGAASGIGLAMAEAFAGRACSIVLADVEPEALEAAQRRVADRGVAALAMVTDVSQAAEVEALAAATLERFGGVDVVCNNAGVAGRSDAWFGPIEAWEWVLGVNFWGVVHGVRAFLPHLVARGGGHVVNTASIAGIYPGFSPPYDASKHAVVAISEGLYHSMRSSGLPIGVSCVCPGWVRTGIVDSDRNWPDRLGRLPDVNPISEIVSRHVGRAVDEGMPPAMVADLVVAAVSDDRYWVFPHPDFLELAVERFHRIGEQLDPLPAEQIPGMPAQAEIVAEVLKALAGGDQQ
jgi:NAD(P)-dependent dehydrogenase (short-subunit alcohol dehydrogenase family)